MDTWMHRKNHPTLPLTRVVWICTIVNGRLEDIRISRTSGKVTREEELHLQKGREDHENRSTKRGD
jgi:hypothetical protein